MITTISYKRSSISVRISDVLKKKAPFYVQKWWNKCTCTEKFGMDGTMTCFGLVTTIGYGNHCHCHSRMTWLSGYEFSRNRLASEDAKIS